MESTVPRAAHCELVRRAGRLFGCKGAFVALADTAQVVPGIDAAGVAVLPVELNSIAADGVSTGRLGRRREHGQDIGGFGFGLTRLAAIGLAQVDAGGTGAGLAQPRKAPRAVVTIDPIDLHALAFGEQNANLLGRNGDLGQCAGLFTFVVLVLLGGDADAFVCHEYSLQRPENRVSCLLSGLRRRSLAFRRSAV